MLCAVWMQSCRSTGKSWSADDTRARAGSGGRAKQCTQHGKARGVGLGERGDLRCNHCIVNARPPTPLPSMSLGSWMSQLGAQQDGDLVSTDPQQGMAVGPQTGRGPPLRMQRSLASTQPPQMSERGLRLTGFHLGSPSWTLASVGNLCGILGLPSAAAPFRRDGRWSKCCPTGRGILCDRLIVCH